MNPLSKAIEVVGLSRLAAGLGVTYQAVRKWEKACRLPRTEWTGETAYASTIERLTDGSVTRDELLAMNASLIPDLEAPPSKIAGPVEEGDRPSSLSSEGSGARDAAEIGGVA